MERARHRKTKSASGIEGTRQVQKQKTAPRLSAYSRSYTDGGNRKDMFMLELGRVSLGGSTGIPMKMLLAGEISKDVEVKKRSPSIIAKLMGLDGLPSPRHVHREQNKVPSSYQQKNVPTNKKHYQLFDGSNRRRAMEQQEFKDVHEDMEASHAANLRCSPRWSADSILTKPEMALIQQKFIDAKLLSTDDKFQNSKVLDDTLEMLDSNKELLMKILGQSDSSFIKHFNDLQVDPSSQIAVLKPLNSEKCESKSRVWRSGRDTPSIPNVASRPKREDGLLLEPQIRRRAHASRSSSRIQLEEEENEEKLLPTRIVVLKPNLGKTQDCGTRDQLYSFNKIKECSSAGQGETTSRRRNDSSYNVRHSNTMSLEAREIAQQITVKMIEGYEESMDAKSTRYRGYVGDESSYDGHESYSESETEVFKLSSRRSFNDGNSCRYKSPYMELDDSSANKEAKKRLSKRWKMIHKYQDFEMVSRASTLGEVLSLPRKEIRPCHLNVKTKIGRASNWLGSKSESASLDGPLGISCNDGRKDGMCRNSSRPRSVPPATGGRELNIRKSCYSDKYTEDNPVRRGRSRVSKGKLSAVENNVPKDSKSRNRKSSSSCEHIFTSEIHLSPEAKFEIQMEPNTKDIPDNKSTFQTPEKDDTSEVPEVDVMIIPEHGKTIMSIKSPKRLPKQPASPLDCDIAASRNEEELQETSPSLQCFAAGVSALECYNVAEHSSPNSVLDVPFSEETPPSESFERVSAELHELRIQLDLLKRESSTSAEEEEVQHPSQLISERHGVENWKCSYAVDVLILSGFEDSNLDMLLHSPNCVVDPKLFNHLEKKYKDEMTTRLREERKLLFDQINSAFMESIDLHLRPWVMPKAAGWNVECVKDEIRDAVERLMDEDMSIKEVTDKELDEEMMWSDSPQAFEMIGNEMEAILIDDMIIELLPRDPSLDGYPKCLI